MPHLREHGDGASGGPCAGIVPPVECATRDRRRSASVGTNATSPGGIEPPAVVIVGHAMARADAKRKSAAPGASDRLR